MRRLPVELEEEVIDDMFDVADKNRDGKIGFEVNFVILYFDNSYFQLLLGVSDHDKPTTTAPGEKTNQNRNLLNSKRKSLRYI